jgi:serine/threonine protein kinase
MAADLSCRSFLDNLRACGLLTAAQLAELSDWPEARDAAATPLARAIHRRRWLTRFQLTAIAAGHAEDLTVGPYVLLNCLGEGGMGKVYKARHTVMGRLVALKVIRKERLANANVVRRFYQEVQLAATLHHPNIVLAYDANKAGNIHYFAMEYVEGVDLARLVKENGPLSWPQACDYIRQAALGLQHAHEKGLIHRDIKPSNLLVSQSPDKEAIAAGPGAAGRGDVVKLLDLGLARLQGEGDTGLTKTGFTVGTPDYMAPEQAMNSHLADIRADLYSLGCTLLYLLTGQLPFGGGELTAVLLKHQMEKPPSLAERGVEAPKGVQLVLDKLTAKDPDDRYQTPAEVVEALAPFCRPESVAARAFRSRREEEPSEVDERGSLPLNPTKERTRSVARSGRKQASDRAPAGVLVRDPKRLWLMIGAGTAVGLLAVALLAAGLYWNSRPPADEHAQGHIAPGGGELPPPNGNVPAEGERPAIGPGAPGGAPDLPAVAEPTKLPLPPGDVCRAATFSPDGKRIALGGSKLRLWDVEGNKWLHDFAGKTFNAVQSLAWSGDGRRLAAGCTSGQVFVLDPETGKVVSECTGHTSQILALAISADGRYVLSGGGKARQANGAKVKGPDGQPIYDDTEIRRWDAATGQQIGRYRGPANVVEAVAFTADDNRFVSYARLANGAALCLWDGAKEEPIQRFDLPPGRFFPAFSPSGRELALLGTDLAWHLHETATGAELRQSERLPRPARGLAWSGDGRYFAYGLSKTPNDAAGALILTEAVTGKSVTRLDGDTSIVLALALSRDGRYLLSAGVDGLRLWDRDKLGDFPRERPH